MSRAIQFIQTESWLNVAALSENRRKDCTNSALRILRHIQSALSNLRLNVIVASSKHNNSVRAKDVAKKKVFQKEFVDREYVPLL